MRLAAPVTSPHRPRSSIWRARIAKRPRRRYAQGEPQSPRSAETARSGREIELPDRDRGRVVSNARTHRAAFLTAPATDRGDRLRLTAGRRWMGREFD